jgi:hypothetical protein
MPLQAVDVFVAATDCAGQRNTPARRCAGSHFLALVVRERFAQCVGDAVQRLAETLQGIGGAGTAHLGQHDKSAGALDQRAYRRTVARALDEAPLPMAGDQPILNLRRSHMDALHARDLAASVRATRTRLARASALA